MRSPKTESRRPDCADKNACLYRFLASEDYREPHITTIPDGEGGKHAMMLDAARRQLCWISHNNTFARLDLQGAVLSHLNLFKDGKAHYFCRSDMKPPRQHHVRIDLATGKREVDHMLPTLKGDKLVLCGLLTASLRLSRSAPSLRGICG